jgi:hypothetical protein
MDWPAFRAEYLPLPIQEHVTLVGETGSGKTTLAARALLGGYPFVVVAGTKRHDTSLYVPLQRAGFEIVTSPRLNAREHPHVIFRNPPKQPTAEGRKRQAERFRALIAVAWDQSRPGHGWTLYLDELHTMSAREQLNLGPEIDLIYTEGRSEGLTLVGATQNPVGVSRVAFDQAQHFFFWQQTELERVKRMAEFAGRRALEVRELVPLLARHELLYLRKRDGVLVRTLPQLRGAG